MPNYRRSSDGSAYEQFQTLDLFEKPDRARGERLARELSLKRWNAGEVIYQPGDEPSDAPTHLYWVVEGRVEESVLHEGKLWLRRDLRKNRYFGQQGLFWGKHQSRAKAANDVELLCVTPAGLREILDQLPKFRERLIPEKRAQQLRKLPLFRSLTDTEIRWLALVTRTVSLASEHTLDLEEKPGLWILGWGRVSIEYNDSALPEGRLTAGGFFLSNDIKIASPRKTKSAETILRSRLYRLPSRYVKNMVGAFPDMRELLAKPRDVPSIIKEIDLFDGEGVTDEHRNHLAQFLGWEFIPANQNITTQGSVGRSFVVVNDGKALVTGRDDKGRERPINTLRAVQGFGYTSLLKGAQRDVTVRAMRSTDENGRTSLDGAECFLLDRRDLQFAFAERPDLWREGVSLFDNFKERVLQKRQYDWLEEGEDPRWEDRRHWLWLAVPLLIYALVASPLLILAVGSPESMRVALLLIWALIFVPVGFFIRMNYYDDYYALTNRRLVRRDRIVLLYRARVQAPLEMVQDVTMQQGFIGNLFNYADINIRTAAKEGSIRFDAVPRPNELRDFIFRQQTESKAAEQGYQREVMRRNLMAELHLVLTISQRKRALGDDAGFSPVIRAWWQQLLHRLAPHRQAQSSPAREIPKYGPGEFVWRKHPLNLVLRAGPSFVVLLLLIFSLPLFLNLGFADPFRIYVIWLVLLFLVLFWVMFQAADYYNDIYVVTDDVIIDIEATPLRLSTQRRQGSLDRVQTVYLSQDGLIPNLLNYGNVIIQTAAVNEGFTFEFVYNPKQVQNQVFQKLQAYRRRREQRDLRQTQRQLLEGLDVYHDLTDNLDWST